MIIEIPDDANDVVFGFFIINFEQTAHLFVVFLLLTLNR